MRQNDLFKIMYMTKCQKYKKKQQEYGGLVRLIKIPGGKNPIKLGEK